MKKVKIKTNDIVFDAIIYDTLSGNMIYENLPIKGKALMWGDEIYFHINLHIDIEKDAKQEVEIGDLGYWPEGPAFCIFFGKTPISTSDKPKAYSPVNVFGKITDNIENLKKVKNGDIIIVESN